MALRDGTPIQTIIDRIAGCRNVAKNYPGIKIVGQQASKNDRASGLANQLLSLSKVEQLKRMGELPSVDLNAIAREAVMELAPLIAAKRLDFALEGPDTLWAPGDAALLDYIKAQYAAGAVGGAILGHPGRGAMVGAASGATAGFLRGLFKRSPPGAAFTNYVDRCLRDRGYDPTGWQ